MPEQSRVQLIKEFFSTPAGPVSNKELMDFKKSDPKGFDELASLVEAEMARKAAIA